jgi:SAM-dependent methyltransferase
VTTQPSSPEPSNPEPSNPEPANPEPSNPYDVDFDWDAAHGRLVKLLIEGSQPGLVVDLGCGYAPHAGPLIDAGFGYVGFDVDLDSIAEVRARGYDARPLDLSAVDQVIATMESVHTESDLPIVAVIAIDVIEHLIEPQVLLAGLTSWMRQREVAHFAVSVPNASHCDVAAKLLAGRWDVTRSGLLDHTHLRFFTDRSLTAVLRSCGLREVARDDRPGLESDQHWPARSPLLAIRTPLGSMLRRVRSLGDDHGATYQFIRLYSPDQALVDAEPSLLVEHPPTATCFLSVLADSRFDQPQLDRLRRQLDAQTCPDFEFLTGGPDVSVERLVQRARGEYVALVDPTDDVELDWVARFASAPRDGRVVRVVDQSDADVFDLLGDRDAIAATWQSAALAFPLDAVEMLSNRLDADLAPSMSLFLDLFQFCGVVDLVATRVPSTWAGTIDRDALDRRVAAVDTVPLLVPAGELARRRSEVDARAQLVRQIDELQRQLDEVTADNAWFASELSTPPVTAVRRILRRRPSRK